MDNNKNLLIIISLCFAFFVGYASSIPQLVNPGGILISNFYFIFTIFFILSFFILRFFFFDISKIKKYDKIGLFTITSVISLILSLLFIYLTTIRNTFISIIIKNKNLLNINIFYIAFTFILIVVIHFSFILITDKIKAHQIALILFQYLKIFALAVVLYLINIVLYIILSFSIYCC